MENGLNKYFHGSVWSVVPGEQALIISSDEHNIVYPEVICLTVTNIQSNGSVYIGDKKYIQCNQIHMVDKRTLMNYEGALPPATLATAKNRISMLIGMDMDTSKLQYVRDAATNLIAKIAMAGLLDEPDSPSEEYLENDTSSLDELANHHNKDPNLSDGSNTKKRKQKRTVRRAYSDADVAYIVKPETSLDEIMVKYNINDRRAASRLKYQLRVRRVEDKK